MKHITVLLLVYTMAFGVLIGQDDYALDWTNDIKVTSGKEKIDGEELHCYSTVIYEVSKGDIKSLISDEVKLRTGEKGSQKKMKEGVMMNFPNYTSEQVLVKSKIEDVKKTDNMKVSIAFFLDSTNVSPAMPKADKAAQEIVSTLGVKLNQAVVAAQITEKKKELEDLEKERAKLVKEREKLNETVADGNEKVGKLESDKAKLESKLVKAQDEAVLLEGASQASTANSKDIKKYAGAKDKVVKLEGDILKNQENAMKANEKINEANLALPGNAEEIEANAAAIESAKTAVEKLNAKFDAIS